ncbi:MAG: chromosome segregation protein SMC [Acidimicrobiales bacterium]
MFLKSLTMKGFKSFAEPTVLELEPGVTVVVGPNGSGKSNVVDAVTWVLGAQGPRTLRSSQMADVIFAGSSSRPPLGRAEVTLTIDNSAGKLPLDMAEVTISRTLFRSGDSEYAINGAQCRLLDIQELLSDTGVGRQQHMIIGQGQLDTVLNARPEDRRAIIEEAAGVRKHRQRRERAERRIAVTQENLERLGDLVREVRRQIRPLERQASAARAHGALAQELDLLARYLASFELGELEERARATREDLQRFDAEESSLMAALGELDAAASSAASELASRREGDLSSSMSALQVLLERTRGSAQVLAERRKALSASLEAAAERDVVSNLETESARLKAELAATETEVRSLDARLHPLAAQQSALHAELEERAARTATVPRGASAAEAFSVTRARVEVLRRTGAQARAGLESLERRMEALERRDAALAQGQKANGSKRQSAQVASRELDETAAEAQKEAVATQALAETAEEAWAQADADRHRCAARAEALARALADVQGSAGREVLRGDQGVMGALVELVEIDQGYESAFEAAAGASVAAVVVEGGHAKAALGRLREQGAAGAVLPASRGPSTWGGLTALPVGCEPLRPHVRPRASSGGSVDGVLDALVGAAVVVDRWDAAVDLSLARRDLTVLTTEGDRFATSGWRARSAARLVTVGALEEAEARAASAAASAAHSLAAREAAAEAAHRGRTRLADAERRRDVALVELNALVAEGERTDADRALIAGELEELANSKGAVAEAASKEAQSLAENEAALPRLEAAATQAQVLAQEAARAARELEDKGRELGRARQELDMAVAGMAERSRVLTERLTAVERRLEGHLSERQEAARRRLRIEADLVALERLAAVVAGQRAMLKGLDAELSEAQRQHLETQRVSGQRLEAIQHDRSAMEARLGEVRDSRRSLDHDAAAVEVRIEALTEMARTTFGLSTVDLRGIECPELPEETSASGHAEELARKLAALGPVNPLALEELGSLEERHRDLEAQVDDVRSARRELQEVIATLDREIAQSFAAATSDVNEHFSQLVASLFPGGTGRLVLTDPADPLSTGVDIEVRPAGRNLRRVSLLSGGERSLCALAFLFAVFRSRPSPFYLMDEVEAALDDVNLHRFLAMVHEFREEAQLIVVSHQKRTMEAADALYGVTMAPGGSSQVVSQRISPTAQPQRAAS